MYKELKDYFPDGITGDGIFTAISQISWFPGVAPSQLDTYFMLMHGEKLASKVLDNFTNDDGVITGDKLKALARMIHNTYINNWEHEYKTLTVEYNPIENTDYVETYKGSASGTAGGTNTETGGVSTENDTYGLGSSAAAHDSKSTTTFNNHQTTLSSTSSGSDEHEIRKHGNIGVTTNAEMIKSDIEVWQLNKFYDILCTDICNIIALSIF